MSAHRVRRFERRLSAALEAALATGMLGVLATIVILVAMRYVFRSGLVGANEIATVVFVYLSSIGAAVAVGRDEHIRVDLLPRRLGRKGGRALDTVSLVLVGTINATVFWHSLAWIGTTGHTPMPASQIPRYVAQASIPLGCGLAVLYCCTRVAIRLREETGT